MAEHGTDRIVPEPGKCPQCGAPLPAGALAGLCPACLLQQGAAPDTAVTPQGKPFEPPSLAEVARLFPQLEIMGFLGKGGMGAVYKARQPALDRLVALKVLPRQADAPAFAERFGREARALARLSHPNIVAVHEFGQVESLHFFIMEFVDGANLRQLEKAGRVSPREAMQIIPQICDALQYAHDEGVVHRDIKPENVLMDRKGRVKIADFGLAKILGCSPEELRLTGEGHVMGTPHYMAPEQFEHPLDVDHRADIYSLGVVFYEMLTGELPLGRFAPPSRKVQVDVRFDEVVLHALEKEPGRRYQQVSEVKTQVQTISNDPGAAAQAMAAPIPAVQKPDRFWRWFAAIVLALISIPLVIAGLGLLAAIVIPNFIKGRQHALALRQAQTVSQSMTNTVPASTETWTPNVEPGEKPDLKKILEDAKTMMVQGQYEESLQRHLWHFNHAMEYGDAYQNVVRLTSALSDWGELARRYPKAKQALIEIRDRETKEIAEGQGYSEMFHEVQAINRELQADEATYGLFETIRKTDPQLAGQCYSLMEDSLMSKGDYQRCIGYIGDPQSKFESLRQFYEVQIDSQKRMAETYKQIAEMNRKNAGTTSWSPPDNAARMKKFAEDGFVGGARKLIEILVGVDRRAEAERIQGEALSVLDDPRLNSAVQDAVAKIKQLSHPAASK